MSVPVLYPSFTSIWAGQETARPTGYLADAISCSVTQELNGEYSLTMTIRYDAPHASKTDMDIGDWILAPNCDHCGELNSTMGEEWQPFRIERIDKNIDGILTIYAVHISYMLNRLAVYPFSASSLAGALAKIEDNYMTTMYTTWFSYSTNISSSVPYKSLKPRSVRNLLAGEEGSIVDVYGQGELELITYAVRLKAPAVVDRGLTIIRGKNMTKENITDDRTNYTAAIVPFWYGDVNVNGAVKKKLVMGSTSGTPTDTSYIVNVGSYDWAIPVDVTDKFSEEPTAAEVRSAGQTWLSVNKPYDTEPTIKISFGSTWQLSASRSPYVLLRLGDTITVSDPRYGLIGNNGKFRVQKLTYDVLRDRYTSIEVGKLSPSLYKTIRKVAKGG